jgi:hypothetical protein
MLTPGIIPAPGSGTSYDPLTPAAAPADQRLTAGTTSSSTITWGTPTGGSGSVSLAVTLDTVHASGTPALSGAGSSRTVTGLSDGDVVLARGVWTDATTGETVEQAVAVSVAQPTSGASWTVGAVDIDFTSADTLSAINSGTLAVTTDSGATALCSIVVDPDSSGVHTVGVTNGTGVVCLGPSNTGRVTAAINLDALLSVGAEDLLTRTYCVQLACEGFRLTGTASSIRWGVGEGTDAGAALSDGLRYLRSTSNTGAWQTLTNGTAENWVTGVTKPDSAVITLYLVAGSIVAGRYDANTATLPAPDMTDVADGTARRVAVNAATAGTGTRYDGSTLYALTSPGGDVDVTITRLRVSVYG